MTACRFRGYRTRRRALVAAGEAAEGRRGRKEGWRSLLRRHPPREEGEHRADAAEARGRGARRWLARRLVAAGFAVTIQVGNRTEHTTRTPGVWARAGRVPSALRSRPSSAENEVNRLTKRLELDTSAPSVAAFNAAEEEPEKLHDSGVVPAGSAILQDHRLRQLLGSDLLHLYI